MSHIRIPGAELAFEISRTFDIYTLVPRHCCWVGGPIETHIFHFISYFPTYIFQIDNRYNTNGNNA